MMRTEKRLEKVGAALIQDIDPETFKSRVPAAQLANLGFVSYLKDMVQAPGPVLAYMCQQETEIYYVLLLSKPTLFFLFRDPKLLCLHSSLNV